MRAEVLNGLRRAQKELPSKYLYDEKGALLFEQICTLDEYYIPRTEAAIMEGCIAEISRLVGSRAMLLEYGAGDCSKVRFLLDNLAEPASYVPLDISKEQLVRAARELAVRYPDMEILPICADYTGGFELPVPSHHCTRTVVYFPGSTISNFDPIPARNFLEHVASVCGPGGGLLIGVDLKKDPAVLHRAYNDDSGVTAAFNLNLLEHINHELSSDFRPDCFEHYAFYNPGEGRIEMHLVSREEQTVHIDGTAIQFARGESIWTESSYKFNLDEFAGVAASAGFRVERVWTDDRNWFSVQYLVAL
jgi:dimethylhistidine N-methyltransferase